MTYKKIAVATIIQKFGARDYQISIPLQKQRPFKALMTQFEMMVDNLGTQPLLLTFTSDVDNCRNQCGGS